jgi:glycosyltransferase involved in cell wall biosynthesis
MTQHRHQGPIASVVIPAHDEENVIERCLRSLLDGTESGELDVVVVANGCKDRTAERARSFGPSVRVVELAQPSKVVALNEGDRAVTAFPRAYLDADIELSAASLRAAIVPLERGEAMCSAPLMRIDLSGSPWFVRAFYKEFAELPYLADDLVGNGVYVLSAEGRERFDDFPELTADDLFVRNLFAPGERRTANGGEFVVHAPRTLSGLLAMRRRVYRGNAEYERLGYVSQAESTRSPSRLFRGLLHRPIATTVFVVVNLVAMLQLRWSGPVTTWERDDSARA